jgi:hypothetical protein
MLVAIARIPERADARARAAQATGLALADLNRRLAGTLPRVLFAGAGPEGERIIAQLEALGFGVLTCDPAAVPGDGERVVVRRIEFAGGALLATNARGETHLLTKKVSQTSTKTTETAEPFLLIQRRDGEPDLIFYERRIDYRALGPDMQPSSRGNLEVLWGRCKAMVLAPAVVDDRVARPGFVSGMPATAAEPIDLALFLVALARRTGA